MMMRNIVLATLFLATLSTVANAQKSLTSLNYAVSLPMGNTADFIDQASGRGIVLDYQRFITRNFALGGEVGHTTLYKREENKVYTKGTASLSGVQYRYQYAYPILAVASYFPTMEGKFKPYGSFGLGTIAQQRKVDMGIFSVDHTHWQSAVKTELGVIVEPAPNVGFKFGVKYNQSFSSRDLDGQSSLVFNFGIVFIN